MIEVEHKLEEAMHFILLNDLSLAECPQYLQKGLSFLQFELFNRHIRHIYDHYIVAQIRFVKADFSQVELRPCLLNFGHRHLLFLLGYEMLGLAV